jgi:uncharacterized protein YbgA (DUF1722 family)/uncharacterized protein YbbK (DUF523 family)
MSGESESQSKRDSERQSKRSSPANAAHEGPIRLGISSCLLGEAVRWDGGHKRDRFIAETLGRCFEWVPVCPELEVGMGTPREPVRLTGSARSPRMVGLRSGEDWTTRMSHYSRERVRRLEEMDLCGYLLKKDSPSCGMERVKIHAGKGPPVRKGTGLFARQLMERFPLLPVEEEGRLQDPRLRENFIVRVFAYRRWKDLEASGCRRGDLVAFHTIHRFLLLAHSPKLYREMGRLVAHAREHSPADLRRRYGETFMRALAKPATVKGHCNVLQHLARFLKSHLGPAERRELQELLEDYRGGRVPLIAPLTLLKHHIRQHGIGYVSDQIYLSPHPKELMLRNHVRSGRIRPAD